MNDDAAALDVPGTRRDRVRDATRLAPVRHRYRWVGLGLLVQLIGVAVPTAFVVVRAKHEAVGGLTLRSTLLIAARESLHDKGGIAALAGGAVVFAVGSMLLARPYVRSMWTLCAAVPLAAIAGVLVLGALALALVIIWIIADAGTGGGGSTGGDRTKRARKPAEDPISRTG